MTSPYDEIVGVDVSGRRLTLERLGQELTAAGIEHRALGVVDGRLHTYDATGYPVDLPPGAQAVVDAHVPDPEQPTQFEQLATAIGAANQATANVTNLDEMKGVVTQLYADLGAILLAGEGQP